MSDLVASIGGLGLGGSLVSEVLGLLNPASFRGVTFDVLDASHSLGRRWALVLFPGRPDTLQEDIGAIDGPLQINALLVGDDYVRRAERLGRALKAEGPAILRHPWLGQIKVTVAEQPRFSFDHQRLRVCAVEMTFRVWEQRLPPRPGSLAALLDAVDDLQDQLRLMLADALAPLSIALGLVTMASGVLSGVASTVSAALASAPTSGLPGLSAADPDAVPGGVAALAAAAAAPLDAMSGGVALQPDATLGGQVAQLGQDLVDAIVASGDPGRTPAIGPGPAATSDRVADPRAAASLLLSVLPQLGSHPGEPDAAVAMRLVARVQIAVAATQAGSLIEWRSRDEALAWRDRLDAALASVQGELAAATTLDLAGLRSGDAWRALRQVRTAWSTDTQERAGRLPPVRHLVTTVPMSAWLIAQAIAGDDPTAVRPAMLDLVARNRVVHPGAVPPGRLEILVA